jgi:hypothetical protein
VIRKRLNHTVTVYGMLQAWARNEAPVVAEMQDRESIEDSRRRWESARGTSGRPRLDGSRKDDPSTGGPRGPLEAPAEMLLQGVTPSSRIRDAFWPRSCSFRAGMIVSTSGREWPR